MAYPRAEDTRPTLRSDVVATYKRLYSAQATANALGVDRSVVVRILREEGVLTPVTTIKEEPVIVWRPGRHGIQYAVSVYDPDADTTSPLRMDRKAS